MANQSYNFKYVPLTGKLPGASMVQQTEQAINELAQIVNEGSAQVEIINNIVEQANDNAAEALTKATEALETSGRVYITLPNLDDADNYYDSQLYYFANKNSSNLPVADTGFLEVKTNDTKTATEQVFIADTTGLMYMRHGVIASSEVGGETVYSVAWETWSSALASEDYVQQEVNTGVDTAKDYTDNKVSIGVPTGCVQAFAGSNTPDGWLLCDGSAVNRETYAALFAAIGTTYGSGNGSTTFNLPNLTNKFIQGNATSGTVKNAGLPNITGSINTIRSENGTTPSGSGALSWAMTSAYAAQSGISSSGGLGISFNASKSNSIYGNSTTVQPPALTMRYIIKY